MNPQNAEGRSNSKKRALVDRFDEVVEHPGFPALLSSVQSECHGKKEGAYPCHWCFQRALGTNLPSAHRYLPVPIVDGKPSLDANLDPVTEDGVSHPWDAQKDRILCAHCLGSDYSG